MVITAAGNAIKEIDFELVFNSQPKDCVAAMVVSEIMKDCLQT
jgi:hypothetical protein